MYNQKKNLDYIFYFRRKEKYDPGELGTRRGQSGPKLPARVNLELQNSRESATSANSLDSDIIKK